MACNLQEEIDIDLEEVFEQSRHSWLASEEIHEIFRKRQDLAVSTEPIEFPEEGLFLCNTVDGMVDNTEWRVRKSKKLPGVYNIRYKVYQSPLIPIDEGMMSTYEKRAYKCDRYGASTLLHYRSHHLSDNSEEIETGEDTEDSQNPSDDDDGDNTETSDGEDDETDTDSDSGGDDVNQDVEVVVPLVNGVC